MTKERIRNWINEFGQDGVYVSFSGGKDSTVLLDIVRQDYPDTKAVFVDVPTQYPELKQFVMTFENVDIVKPKISFAQVCEEYGFPLISKEVSEKAMYARKYLKKYLEQNRTEQIPYAFAIMDFIGIPRRKGQNKDLVQKLKNGNIPSEMLEEIFGVESNAPFKAKCLFGTVVHKKNGIVTDEISKMFDYSKYKFLINAPFDVSNKCCDVMKKNPIHEYAKKTGRMPITATMAAESKLRTQNWLQNGCNGFGMKSPVSTPMAFWTEQDVLLYIKENNLPICSVYGDVVVDYSGMGQCDNQMSFSDFGLSDEKQLLKTTGCNRTGCVLCGFGCHLEKESRFELLKQTHPKFHNLLYILKNNGVTYAEAIDWVNEHGGFNIKY
ncbi:phosphoadenosine phosphosulfate reductase domain-containing protein [Eubacterium ramulus]